MAAQLTLTASCISIATSCRAFGRLPLRSRPHALSSLRGISRLSRDDQSCATPDHRRLRQGHSSRAIACSAMTEASVGEWKSPITSESITSSSIRLGSARAGSDGFVYYLEGRPSEGGRYLLVRQKAGGEPEQLTPGPESELNVRTRVHEYGGGESIIGDGVVYFSNFKDQRLYKQEVSPAIKPPEPLTAEGSELRFADGIVDSLRNRIITVQEDHSGKGEAVNTIAALDLNDGKSSVLVKGRDFYSNPALSADGSKLAWVCWDHPSMPWEDTEVWVADIDASGNVTSPRKVAGGQDESVLQPAWTKDGLLIFISDRTNWWNLYLETAPGSVKALFPKDAEFAGPAWVFGMRSYALLPDGRILAQYSDPTKAGSTVAVIDPNTGSSEELDTPFASLGSISVSEAGGKLRLATVGTSPKKPSAVAVLEVASPGALAASTPADWTILRESSKSEIDEGYLTEPMSIEFPTENGLTAFMNYYPPKNKDFKLPAGEQPPLLVKIHGGPTSQASTAFSPVYQYWTSRGFAIADVNYGGSTGYGREYRKRLKDNWGIVDVDDCCNAATHLAKEGKVDGNKLCIDGGSAGGYTTLAALAFKDVFSAGASHFGVADCELLAQETHKFESRYLDNLIGPYPAAKATYMERSPIHSVDKFSAPIIFFQGLEDKVVPPNQAVDMYNALKAKGVTTALVLFEGEQHGFRGTDAIRRALDGELYFYGKALGFKSEMPSDLPEPEIVNLK